MSAGLGNIEVLLRTELEANPFVLPPWEVGRPAYVVFAENLGDVDVDLHIKGGPAATGPFVRQYGSDSIISIPARAKMIPAVITDIAKFVALHLTADAPDGLRVTLVMYQPVPQQDVATESLTVV